MFGVSCRSAWARIVQEAAQDWSSLLARTQSLVPISCKAHSSWLTKKRLPSLQEPGAREFDWDGCQELAEREQRGLVGESGSVDPKSGDKTPGSLATGPLLTCSHRWLLRMLRQKYPRHRTLSFNPKAHLWLSNYYIPGSLLYVFFFLFLFISRSPTGYQANSSLQVYLWRNENLCIFTCRLVPKICVHPDSP